jgi:hypothetical protein
MTGVHILETTKDLYLLQNVLTGYGSPPSLPFTGYQGSSMGVKQTGHEFGLSPPSSAEVKNETNNNSMLPTCLHDMQRETLHFTLHYM